MKWYYTSFITTETFNYTDGLGAHQYIYENSTGFVYKEYDSIIVSYTLSSNAYQYSIELWKNDTQIFDSLFPKNVSYPSGSLGYTPTTIGKYVFKLKSYYYVYNLTTYTISNNNDFIVSTSPIITNQFDSYTVYYKYYHPQNITGILCLFSIKEQSNIFSNAIYSNQIVKNEKNNFIYQSTGKASEFWRLFVNNSYNYLGIGNIHTHYIRIPSIFENDIYPVYNNINISINNIEDKTQYIKGKHTFIGCNVFVTINGLKSSASYVGDNQEFQVSYIPRTPGIYNVSLYVEQNGTDVLLDYCSFTVSYRDDIELPQETLFFIPPPWSYFAGVFIIILFTLTPIIFGYMFKLNLDSIPQFLYLVFAVVGFIVSILFGFFPAWSIIVLIVIAIFIVFIMWQQKKIA
jgi:hypothetical protein